MFYANPSSNPGGIASSDVLEALATPLPPPAVPEPLTCLIFTGGSLLTGFYFKRYRLS
jgi:hypothetical protein